MTDRMWTPAYIGVGSNLDDPAAQVRRALTAMADLRDTRVIAHSRLFSSPPLGPQDQPQFVNAAAAVLTQLEAQALLAQLKDLETKLGKSRPAVRWGARVIDLDLLVYGSSRIATDVLTVPHLGFAERPFVLKPMLDIAPDMFAPGLGNVRSLAARIDLNAVQVLNG